MHISFKKIPVYFFNHKLSSSQVLGKTLLTVSYILCVKFRESTSVNNLQTRKNPRSFPTCSPGRTQKIGPSSLSEGSSLWATLHSPHGINGPSSGLRANSSSNSWTILIIFFILLLLIGKNRQKLTENKFPHSSCFAPTIDSACSGPALKYERIRALILEIDLKNWKGLPKCSMMTSFHHKWVVLLQGHRLDRLKTTFRTKYLGFVPKFRWFSTNGVNIFQ